MCFSSVSAYAHVVGDLAKLSCTCFACVYVASSNQSLPYNVFQQSDCCVQCSKNTNRKKRIVFLYTSHATTSALEIRCNFAARNVSPCPSLFDRQNHKYLNIKVRVCMQTQQNLKNKYKCRKAAKLKSLAWVKWLDVHIKRPFPRANSYNSLVEQHER